MAIKNTQFKITIGTPPLTAQVSITGTYARLSEVVVTNRYEAEQHPNPAKATDPTASDYLQVFVKKQTVTGKLDIYALDTDPSTGVSALVTAREYSCPHVSGSIAEIELYAYIMALPEFTGCAAT